MCSFGLPYELVIDNDQQFTGQSLVSFFQEVGIKTSHSTSYRPQAKGLMESLNKTLINILCKRLEGV